MNTIVVYESGDEVLITSKENEQTLINDWFDEKNRDIADYDRSHYQSSDVIVIRSKLSVR